MHIMGYDDMERAYGSRLIINKWAERTARSFAAIPGNLSAVSEYSSHMVRLILINIT